MALSGFLLSGGTV
jgi:glc operon protein GlcG